MLLETRIVACLLPLLLIGCGKTVHQPTGCVPSVSYSDAQGGGGELHAVFVVKVRSGSCSLKGYPTVTLLGKGNRPFRTRQTASTLPPLKPRTVELGPRHLATFEIDYVFNHVGGSLCQEIQRVRVRLPQHPKPQVVAISTGPDARMFSPCGGRIQVGPLLADGGS